jgi:L-ascorbate metabolism protein UlaG (beta-lactamase superfamily)
VTRRRGDPPASDELSTVDAALVSHLHHDHCHLPSLRRLPPGTRVLLPRGGGGLLAGLPLDVQEVVPGDVVDVGGVAVQAVRAYHDGRRHPGSSWTGPALGFVVHAGMCVWFAGDTGWTQRLGADVDTPDVALLPVGGWGPIARPSVAGQHLDPHQAARLAHRVGALRAVPVHYGTLWPAGLPAHRSRAFTGPGHEFARWAAATAPRTRVWVARPGESWDLADDNDDAG